MLIKDEERKILAKHFEKLTKPVKLVVFSQRPRKLILPENVQCSFCRETEGLTAELAELHENVTVETYDFFEDQDQVREYGVNKIPAIAMVGEKDYGVRYYGAPVGYEFSAFIEDMVDVALGTTNLDQQVKDRLKTLDQDLHFQVFTTPQCPYCPQAVRTAHQLAIESDKVTADMVESTEFPYLVQLWNVMGVPQTIVNDQTEPIPGAMPGPLFLLYALKVTGQMNEQEAKHWETIEGHLKKQLEASGQMAPVKDGDVGEHVHDHEHEHEH